MFRYLLFSPRSLIVVGAALAACSTSPPPAPAPGNAAGTSATSATSATGAGGSASLAGGGGVFNAGGTLPVDGGTGTSLGGSVSGAPAGSPGDAGAPASGAGGAMPDRLLYVASPGIRNYVEWGGKGVLVFDIDDEHRFVRRIASPFTDSNGEVENIKGIAASAESSRLFLTTPTRVAALDLRTDKLLWLKRPSGGCDRPAITQDGNFLYVPSFEGPHWTVLDASSGETVRTIVTNQKSHNTLAPPGANRVYLAGIGSPLLISVDPATHSVVEAEQVGPFGNPIRPFSISMARQLVVANVNDLLGFEVGELATGKKLYEVKVPGFAKGPYKRHGTVSHGVGITPDDAEVWVVDAPNQQVHIFDLTKAPPSYEQSVALAVDQPGWITFSILGDYAYPSTGEVIDTRSRKIVAWLKDEGGDQVQSEKMLEIDFLGERPLKAGDQFGVGRSHQVP